MRTKRTLTPRERRIFHPELKECPHCGAPLELCGYWRWDKTVQTLKGVISAASRPSRCTNPDCPAPESRYVSAAGAALSLPESTYGLDVVVRVGWLRERCHLSMAVVSLLSVGSRGDGYSHQEFLNSPDMISETAGHGRRSWQPAARGIIEDLLA